MIQKVALSACLLGCDCRYDANHNLNQPLLSILKNFEIIPFCPEDPVMGTPRERISVVEVDGVQKVIVDTTKVEVTTALKLQTEMMMADHADADVIILKSKSPSCGLGTTPILNTKGKELKRGNGLAAQLFSEKFVGKVFDENTFGC